MTPRDIQKLLDELTASRRSRKRAWEVLQEIRWVLKDTVGVELPDLERKTIDRKAGLRRLMPPTKIGSNLPGRYFSRAVLRIVRSAAESIK